MRVSRAAPVLLISFLLSACAASGTAPVTDLRPIEGPWRATLDGRFHLDIEIRADEVLLADGDAENNIVVRPHEVRFDDQTFEIVFDHSPFMPAHIEPPTPGHGDFTMTAAVENGTMTGTGTRADGKAFEWTAVRIAPPPDE